jgi:hypothetical protein
MAYLGCRNGNVMCVDIRENHTKQKTPFNVSGKTRSSATCLKVLQDENYLMTSSIEGMVSSYSTFISD